MKIKRNKLKTLNNFQKLLGDINWLRTAICFTTQVLSNLFQPLLGFKVLNSPRKVSAKTENELALVEKKLQGAHLYHIDPKIACILIILPSTHSPIGILMQREDYMLEWIFKHINGVRN